MSDAARQRDDLLDEETTMTEITIRPDGRIYVFGTSRRVLEVLDGLRPNDARLGQLLRRARETEARPTTPTRRTTTTHGDHSRAT
jgi:hypothetical protein